MLDSIIKFLCILSNTFNVVREKSMVLFSLVEHLPDINDLFLPHLFSAGGEVNCLYYTTSSSVSFLHVFNLDSTTDESTYFRFTCYVSFFICPIHTLRKFYLKKSLFDDTKRSLESEKDRRLDYTNA